MRLELVSDHDRLLPVYALGLLCLGLDVVVRGNVHAVSGLKSRIDKGSLVREWVLMKVRVEEVHRGVFNAHAFECANVDVVSEYRGNESELFCSFENTNEVLECEFLWLSLELLPLGVELPI